MFYPDLIKELFQYDITANNHKVNYNLKQVEVDLLLESFKDSISILLDNPNLADESMIKTKLKEFVLLMSKTVEAPSQLDFLSAMFKPNYADFKTIIQHNLYTNLTLDQFAALCHMSTSSFKRKFKEVFNQSPKKYISNMKMQRASELLKDKDLRISQIAFDLGYDSLVTFNRVFKMYYKQSPSSHRLS